MERVRFQSTMLSEGAYDAEARTLELTYAQGQVYRYSGVPSAAWEELKAAPSVGSYFQRNIRGKYDFERG